MDHFSESGWSDIALEEGAELNPENLTGRDPEVIQAYEACLAHGTAGIVFRDAISEQ